MSPSIISTLTSRPCTTLSSITRSTRNEKYKRGKRRRTKLNYPKLKYGKKIPKTNLKTTQKLLSQVLEKPQGFIGKRGEPGYCTEPRVKSWRAAPQGSRENAAMVAPRFRGHGRAARCLLRCPFLSPCRLNVPLSGIWPLCHAP